MKKLTFFYSIILLFSALFICFLFCTEKVTGQTTLKVINLKCEHKVSPLGIQNLHPMLSWNIISDQPNHSQSVCQILVADTKEKLNDDNGNIWDSKKVKTNSSIGIPYNGVKLEPAKNYYWKVRIWDNSGQVSSWSDPALFVTGLFSEKDWKGAQWIVYEDFPDSLKLVPGVHNWGPNIQLGSKGLRQTVIPFFRKEFIADKKINHAFVMVCGLGHYELTLNGKKIGDSFLSPGWTKYEIRCLYNMYDITNELNKGSNVIGATVGNGFFNVNKSERYKKLVVAYGSPTLICQLKIEYTDGSEEVIVTDKDWKTDRSPVTFSTIYGGEDYDANLEQSGWDIVGFDDSKWKDAIVSEGPGGTLDPEIDHPLKVMQAFSSPAITYPDDSKFIYDFKQNASGIVKLTVKGKKDQTLRIWPGELLDKDSLVGQKSSGAPYYFQYTLKSSSEEVWIPRFTYYGFRYVQVEGALPKGAPNPENLPEITELQMLHTRNSSPVIGTFSCSNKLYNDIYTLIDWSIKSNLASVTTDCPHREKLGWLEVTHLMGNSINYIYDIHNLYDKIVTDMMESQLENGLVPDIAPEFVPFIGPMRDSPEWGSSCIILPWYLYKWYGNTRTMKKAYPMMKAYIAYLLGKSDGKILGHGLGDWCDIVPGNNSPLPKLTPVSLTGTAIFYYDLTLMTKMAELLNFADEARYYGNLAEELRIIFNNKYFSSETKMYSTGSQTALSMPLYFGMVDKEHEKDVAANLAKSVRQNKYALTSGDIGYRYLLRALEQFGYSSVIDSMNSRTDVPGYGYQLSKGATSLTEKWDASAASHNHMMLGHLMEWLYSGLGGIKQSEKSVAFKEIVIEPQLVGDVTWCKTSYDSPYGIIKCNWQKSEKLFSVDIEIPFNTTASIRIPAITKDEIMVNGHPLQRNEFEISSENLSKALFKLGSGKYNVIVKKNINL